MANYISKSYTLKDFLNLLKNFNLNSGVDVPMNNETTITRNSKSRRIEKAIYLGYVELDISDISKNVIRGKDDILALQDYINNKFALKNFNNPQYDNLKFSDLQQNEKNSILQINCEIKFHQNMSQEIEDITCYLANSFVSKYTKAEGINALCHQNAGWILANELAVYSKDALKNTNNLFAITKYINCINTYTSSLFMPCKTLTETSLNFLQTQTLSKPLLSSMRRKYKDYFKLVVKSPINSTIRVSSKKPAKLKRFFLTMVVLMNNCTIADVKANTLQIAVVFSTYFNSLEYLRLEGVDNHQVIDKQINDLSIRVKRVI